MNSDIDQSSESLKYRHLELIQGVVSRMARNSVLVKIWTVSIVTVYVFSGFSDNPHWLTAVGGCFSIFGFWYVDARYLQLERCYVRLHNAVVNGKQVLAGDLNYRPYIQEVDTVFAVSMSWSVFIFYGILLILMVFLFWIKF